MKNDKRCHLGCHGCVPHTHTRAYRVGHQVTRDVDEEKISQHAETGRGAPGGARRAEAS